MYGLVNILLCFLLPFCLLDRESAVLGDNGLCYNSEYACAASCKDSCQKQLMPYCCSYGTLQQCYPKRSMCSTECTIGTCVLDHSTLYCCSNPGISTKVWVVWVVVLVVIVVVCCGGFWMCFCCPFCLLAKSRSSHSSTHTTIGSTGTQPQPCGQQNYGQPMSGYTQMPNNPAPPNYNYNPPAGYPAAQPGMY